MMPSCRRGDIWRCWDLSSHIVVAPASSIMRGHGARAVRMLKQAVGPNEATREVAASATGTERAK